MEASTSDEYDDFAKTLEEELMMLDKEDHGAYLDDEGSQDMHNECSGSGGVELDHSDSSFDGSDSSFDGSDCEDVESKFPNLFTKRLVQYQLDFSTHLKHDLYLLCLFHLKYGQLKVLIAVIDIS